MNNLKVASLLTIAALLLPLAHAQAPGVVEGKLTNGTNPAVAPAGVQLDVIGLGSGMNVIKSSVSDAAGKFRIEGLTANTPYLIRATYKSVNYFGHVNLDAAGKAQVEIQVFEQTSSMKGIRLENVRLGFRLIGDRLRSLESYTFINETKPPQSFMRDDGNFRFSKAEGITEPPRLDVTAPGSSMPVTQAPLESADGQSYYSLYPLKPGTTTFEVEQVLPYQAHAYTYRKKFFEDMSSVQIAVIPQDMTVAGEGLSKVAANAAENFAVYSMGPIKAGAEVVWKFSGGTPVAEAPSAQPPASSSIQAMPTLIAQNAPIIGVLLLLSFILVLFYASGRLMAASERGEETRIQELKERREQLLNYIAALDIRNESQPLDKQEYQRLREHGKRHLRRIATLLTKK